LVILFRTKDFDEEHRADNQKIVSKLLQEFKTTLDRWIEKRATITEEWHLTQLLPELEKLSKIGGLIEKWNRNITTGKGLLHKAAGAILATGIFVAIGLAFAAAEEPSLYQYVWISVILGLVAGGYAYRFMRDYLTLKSEIARKGDDLRIGRPVIQESEL